MKLLLTTHVWFWKLTPVTADERLIEAKACAILASA